MESTKVETEIALDMPPFLKVYKDGRVERFLGTGTVPPSEDPNTGVSSRDVVIDSETGVSARLFLPKITDPNKKLPLLVYFHGGCFVIESPFSPSYHTYASSIASEANVVVLSVDYRKAPEHLVPIAHEDSWVAVKWVFSHAAVDGGSEPWIKTHVDFDRVFVAGESAGGNISHNMAIRIGVSGDVKLAGAVLVQPYFWGAEPIGSEGVARDRINKETVEQWWVNVYPSMNGFDDPIINPLTDPNLAMLGCDRVLVFVAEKDIFRDRGVVYCEKLRESGWSGVAEMMESEGEDHVFHLFNPTCEKAKMMMNRLASFVNQETGIHPSL